MPIRVTYKRVYRELANHQRSGYLFICKRDVKKGMSTVSLSAMAWHTLVQGRPLDENQLTETRRMLNKGV